MGGERLREENGRRALMVALERNPLQNHSHENCHRAASLSWAISDFFVSHDSSRDVENKIIWVQSTDPMLLCCEFVGPACRITGPAKPHQKCGRLVGSVESWRPMSRFHRRRIFLNICIEKDRNVGIVVHAFQGIFPKQEKLRGTFGEDWFSGETGVRLSPLPARMLVRGRSTLLENMFAFHSWST